jgi:membrane-associated phospholipid phosphatase
MPSQSFWLSLTSLGEASFAVLLTPILVFAASHPEQRLRAWLSALGWGALLALLTKLAYMGWHLGIPALAFTGISGHAYLAASLLPFWLSLLLPRRRGLVLGLVLAALVASSRVLLGAHSPAEALAGWLLGGAVAITGLQRGETPALPRWQRMLPWFALVPVGVALVHPEWFIWVQTNRLELGLAARLRELL